MGLELVKVIKPLFDNRLREVRPQLDCVEHERSELIDYGVSVDARVILSDRHLLINEVPQLEVGVGTHLRQPG